MNENAIIAGRLENDIDINDLAEKYKRNVFDLISLLKFKTVVFDYDGTLTKFKYADKNLLPCLDDEINEYCEHNDMYSKAVSQETMQYILNELYDEEIYILTVSQSNVEKQKTRAILRAFPTIKPENIIHVNLFIIKLI